MTAAGGASAVPADGGSSPPFPGGSDIMPAGTMTGARGARCNWVRHRRHVRFVWCTYSRKPGPSCALGTTTPFGKNRGGTPEDVLPPPIPTPACGGGSGWGAVPQPARPRRLRNSVLRRSASFYFFVARIEQSEIRGRAKSLNAAPGFRCTQPALHRDGTLINPVTATGFI